MNASSGDLECSDLLAGGGGGGGWCSWQTCVADCVDQGLLDWCVPFLSLWPLFGFIEGQIFRSSAGYSVGHLAIKTKTGETQIGDDASLFLFSIWFTGTFWMKLAFAFFFSCPSCISFPLIILSTISLCHWLSLFPFFIIIFSPLVIIQR